ncbi:MAG: radical SAM protein [Candidatus Bathyarchaeia archaeon]
MGAKGPLYIVPWRCTFACNSRCVHCVSAGKPPNYGELDTSRAMQLIDRIYEFGASFVGITGGEPFLRRDLFEIIAYARKIGLRCSIITDGRLLNGEAFKEIVKNEVLVSVSIDGAEGTNDLVRGMGAYKAALSAIKRLSSEKLLNCLVYTLANCGEASNVSIEDFVHVLNLARDYGARWVIFHQLIPYSGDAASLEAVPSPQQYEWAWNRLYELQEVYKGKPAINVYSPFFARIAKQRGMSDFEGWYNGFFLGRCFFGKFMSIAENGDAIPCSYNDFYRLGNALEKPLKSIWDEMQASEFFSRIRNKNSLKGKCAVCEYRDICGGCRTAALYQKGDIFESDPNCAYVPKALRPK